MDFFNRCNWFYNNGSGDRNVAVAPAAISGANSFPSVTFIDFFAAERERMPASAERERMPASPPSPDNLDDFHLEPFTFDNCMKTELSTSPQATPVIYGDGKEEEEFKEEIAAVLARLQRVNEDNQRLRSTINDMRAQLGWTRRTDSLSSSSTPSPDAVDVIPRWPVFDLRRTLGYEVPESSNAAAMKSHKRPREEKEVGADAASNDREEEDDNEHHGQNSKKFRSSPSPPEKDDAADMKKHRVVVRIRTKTGDINGAIKIDGCQWRKYGQKTPASSPKTPRCYYRCSMARKCPMRKRLQKCADDESTLDVTYYGAHNHPLPPEAVPIARAVTAALEMVTSGSMPRGEALMDTSALAKTMSAPLAAVVSILSPFPSAQLDLSKSLDPAWFQGQPPAVFADAAAPGEPPRMIQMSAATIAELYGRGDGGSAQ